MILIALVAAMIAGILAIDGLLIRGHYQDRDLQLAEDARHTRERLRLLDTDITWRQPGERKA